MKLSTCSVRPRFTLPSARPYRRHPDPHYPFHDKTVVVTNCGRLCLYRKKINLSTSLAGQAVGIKEVDDGIWLVSFMDYDLGYIDLEEKTLQPLDNPFGPKVLPMSPVLGTFCYLCLRTGQQVDLGRLVGFEPTTSRTTIWRYYQLSYSRRVNCQFNICVSLLPLVVSDLADVAQAAQYGSWGA